jgi:hypothetical protein
MKYLAIHNRTRSNVLVGTKVLGSLHSHHVPPHNCKDPSYRWVRVTLHAWALLIRSHISKTTTFLSEHVQTCASQKSWQGQNFDKFMLQTSSTVPIPNTRYLYHSECIYMLSKHGLRVWDIVCLLLLAVIACNKCRENLTLKSPKYTGPCSIVR